MKTVTRPELRREAIVDRALAIVDVEGLDAITIRRLATEFGVTPMALYWHVKNKDELLAAMGDRLFDAVALDAVDGDWTVQLRTITTRLVDALRAHPGASRLAAVRVLACPTGQALTEQALALLRGAGFSVVAASDIARTALQTAVMLVSEQGGPVPGVESEAGHAAKRAALAGLPRASFPNLVECADALTGCEDDSAYFGFGIDLFVTGVERLQKRL